MKSKEEFIDKLFEKGILVNKELLDKDVDDKFLEEVKGEDDLIVLNDDYVEIISKQKTLVDWYEIDQHRVDFEKEGDQELYDTQLQDFRQSSLTVQTSSSKVNGTNNSESTQELESLETELDKNKMGSSFQSDELNVKEQIDQGLIAEGDKQNLEHIEKELDYEIVYSYETISHKYTVKDFSKIFLTRYRYLERIIRQHPEIGSLVSINRLKQKKEKEKVNVIGLVNEIAETRNSNLILTIEDPTGKIKVLISKNKEDLFKKGKELVHDEVIGIVGVSGNDIIFAEDVVWPDIPSTNEMLKSKEEEYAIFLSDIHVGSDNFLEDSFNKFLKWLNGEAGNDKQKALASKVKYIFIAGDLVDGVGIYPAQESELTITDITEQYDEFVRLISQVPKNKQIFVCPGNHDAVHLAEPQSVFYKEYCNSIYELENVTVVSNPGMINIGKKKDFSGFNILMYHGYSFDYYVSNIDMIRNEGGYERADLIMQFLLKRRHLAPAFKSTPYIPAFDEDPLMIKKIPDIIITGHIHYSSVANYKGVTMICGSCWQGKTKFQEKLGHNPQPGRVPLVNLKTRDVKVLKFV